MSRNLRKLLYFSLGGMTGIGVVLGIFMGVAVFQARYYLESFIEEAPQYDLPLVYEKIAIRKVFPLAILKVKRLGVDGWHGLEGEAPETFIQYSLFHPHTLTIKIPIAEIRYKDITIVLTDLEIMVDPFSFGNTGSDITFQKITLLQNGAVKGEFERGSLSLQPKIMEAHNDQGTYTIPALLLKAEGKEIHLKENIMELGQDIKDISLRITIQESISLLSKENLSFQECLKQWREKGGAVDLEKVAFTWGSIWANIEGTLALEADLFPEGSFTFHLKGVSLFLRNLVKNKKMPPDQRVIVQMALGLLEAGTQNNFILPVTLQNKKIRAGNFLEIPLE